MATIPELVKFREKYPDYGDMSDAELAGKLAAKYPDAYGDLPGKVSATSAPAVKYDPANKQSMDYAEKMRREFIQQEKGNKTIGEKLSSLTPGQIAKNVALEAPRIAQEMVTVPLSSATKAAYGLGALARTGGELIRGKSTDEALQAGSEVMKGYSPTQGPLDPSMVGTAIGTGVGKLSDLAERATGNTGFAKAGIEATADIAGLIGGGKAISKVAPVAGRTLRDLTFKGAEKIGFTPEKLYASSLKQSTAIPMQQRAANIATGLEGGYIPTKKGLDRLYNDISDVNNQIGTAINESAANGKTIKVDSIISRLDEVKQRASDTFGDNNGVLAKLDDFAQSLRDHSAVKNGEIPVDVAQRLKVNTYKELKKAYGELKGFEIEGKKAMARGAKDEIVAQIPELALLNAKDSALINLEKVLFKAVNRIENRDLIGIGVPIKVAAGAMGGPKGAIIGLISGVLDTPAIKGQLAVAMHKARGRAVSAKELNGVIEGLKAQAAAETSNQESQQ